MLTFTSRRFILGSTAESKRKGKIMQFIRDIMTEKFNDMTEGGGPTWWDTPSLLVNIGGMMRCHDSEEYASAVEWLIGEHDVVFKFEEDGDEITDVEIVQIAGNGVIHRELYDVLGRDFVERLVRYARDNYEDVSKWGETQ